MNKKIMIAKVIDDTNVVLNIGSNENVSINDRFLIYQIGEEIFDPDTKESLGNFEIVKGYGKVTHIQNTMCTLTSDKIKREQSRKIITTQKSNGLLSQYFETNPKELVEEIPGEEYIVPFDNPEIGDLAKPLTIKKSFLNDQ
ncbi:MAG: hypothetical protein E7E42_01915 [Veillonella sp.]|uniref:hypothetical protein n=1 Tax=Veillonella sp. TaxID=1926307 RepID=UPI0028FF45FC|nr:hypothetical protein [Veillonella sp.]MDU2208422.1 hypothetical protein [Veillonella sp.]MDU3706194.1 hypothetical protein [Veillonella sp.]